MTLSQPATSSIPPANDTHSSTSDHHATHASRIDSYQLNQHSKDRIESTTKHSMHTLYPTTSTNQNYTVKNPSIHPHIRSIHPTQCTSPSIITLDHPIHPTHPSDATFSHLYNIYPIRTPPLWYYDPNISIQALDSSLLCMHLQISPSNTWLMGLFIVNAGLYSCQPLYPIEYPI